MILKNGGIPHYPLYLLAGLACWIFFSVSLQTAARSLVDSAELIRKVRFPRQLVAFSVVATQAVTFARDARHPDRALAHLRSRRRGRRSGSSSRSRVLFVALVAGLALLVACLNVLFRDVEHILAAALLPWFFLTPILWRFATLHASARSHHG